MTQNLRTCIFVCMRTHSGLCVLGFYVISTVFKSGRAIWLWQRARCKELNTFTAKPLRNQYLSAKHVLLIIYQFYYLPINYFLKISACYISLERDFIAEYSAISLIKLLPLNHSIAHHLNLVPAGQLELLMAVNGKNNFSHWWQRKC